MSSENSSNSKKYILLLFLIHISSHYFTLERLSFGQDTYADKLRFIQNKYIFFFDYFKLSIDRPINFLFIDLQNILISNNVIIGLFLLILSTFFLVICIFYLVYILAGSYSSAFITAVIFDLLPFKSEIFHNVVFLNINIVSAIYLVSIITFILYQKNERIIYFAISCISYLLGVFWYEIGFFLPIFYLIYLISSKSLNKKNLYLLLIIISISIFYLLYRYFNSFGLSLNEQSHIINLSKDNKSVSDLVNFLGGRYLAKYIIYGIYEILNLKIFNIFLIIILNISLVYLIFNSIKRRDNFNIDKKILLNFLSLFFIIMIPIILNGSAAGRHLIIPAIFVSMILIKLIFIVFQKNYISVISFLIFFLLLIAQGNSITQTNTMRIERDLVEYVKENKKEILNSEIVLFDSNSFMKNIRYSLVKNDNNFFNTYFGYQMFEKWGVSSIINLYSDNYKLNKIKEITYTVNQINLLENNILEYYSIKQKKYGEYETFKLNYSNNSYFIINFDNIYSNSNRNFKKF